MNLKTRTGEFLCTGCGNPVEPANDMAARLLKMGKPVTCENCRRAGGQWATYEAYLASYTWQAKADECKRRAGRRCQICNSPNNLEAHHRVYVEWGTERVEDLLCACRSCHAIITEHVELYHETI